LSYQVFIEGLKSGARVASVAEAISKSYGLPQAALEKRLAGGRFRIKNGVELDEAKGLVTALEGLGARASAVDADGKVVIAASVDSDELDLELMPPGPSAPAAAAAIDIDEIPLGPSGAADIPLGPPGAASDSPLAGIRTTTAAPEPSPLAGITATRAAVQEDTGLAAALAGGADQDLGVLGSAGALSVASLDGADEPAPIKTATGASFAPPTDEAAFLPPDALAEQKIEVDAADLPKRTSARRSAEIPQAEDLNIGGANAALGEAESPRGNPLASLWATLNEDGRKRFAAGIVLVTLLGFVPVHLYATMSEDSAYTKMRADVRETQSLVEDIDEWNALEEYRAGVAKRMDNKRFNIALTGSLMWIALSSGLGFVFFRKLPWDDNGPRIAKAPELGRAGE